VAKYPLQYTRSYVVEHGLRKHRYTVREWLEAVLKSAEGIKVKLLPQVADYTALILNEEYVIMSKQNIG